jgi:cell wall-associated NlpC family hydrolase
MQQALGRAIDRTRFGRGDLVFWKGHVAMGLGEGRIIHANAHHMAVAVEPLDEAVERIKAAGSGEPTAFRRI